MTRMADGKRTCAIVLVAALCGLAQAGEVTSALVGKIRYDETPGWALTVDTARLADGREKIAVRPCSAIRLD